MTNEDLVDHPQSYLVYIHAIFSPRDMTISSTIFVALPNSLSALQDEVSSDESLPS